MWSGRSHEMEVEGGIEEGGGFGDRRIILFVIGYHFSWLEGDFVEHGVGQNIVP